VKLPYLDQSWRNDQFNVPERSEKAHHHPGRIRASAAAEKAVSNPAFVHPGNQSSPGKAADEAVKKLP